MMKPKNLFFTFILLCICNLSIAQETTETNQEETSSAVINNQFDELIESSNNYQDYKVVKRYELIQLQKSTVKKVDALNEIIVASKKTINEQNTKIEDLKTQLSDTQNNLNKVTEEKDQILFFGLPTDKGTYQTIMWVIIFALILILLFFIYKFKQSNILTKEAKKNLAENEVEFDEYRKQALEKQQKLGRQLQDEKNKQAKNKH
ncbi:hypothetical protein SAMN04488096_102287 [Mesonia phycicola]|uniref:tRNA (Guanine-N1)-methyltransferase n=1 Tax=Mesonia phycicola TaxID=579105 RepID=A0A1M6BZ94_9FLAO|nr:hypothetical protein [Mesonia phycicola]SHI53983.1 hypothetical protein SAMN04488096_102287 [Mesonia phycicola]